jgi:thiol:disulfide interchange protein
MVLRWRDPLVRFLGFLLLYCAAFLAITWLPGLWLERGASVLIIAVCGWLLMRNRKLRWCPQCWLEAKPH